MSAASGTNLPSSDDLSPSARCAHLTALRTSTTCPGSLQHAHPALLLSLPPPSGRQTLPLAYRTMADPPVPCPPQRSLSSPARANPRLGVSRASRFLVLSKGGAGSWSGPAESERGESSPASRRSTRSDWRGGSKRRQREGEVDNKDRPPRCNFVRLGRVRDFGRGLESGDPRERRGGGQAGWDGIEHRIQEV